MRAVAAVIVALSLPAPAVAQVIQGESTYEDNFAHVPPAPDPPAKADVRPSGTDPASAKTPTQDLRRRDRD